MGSPLAPLVSTMSVHTWNDALRVGVAPMDRAHNALADLVDEIEMAVRRDRDPREIQDLLLRLVEETSDHFSEEQDLMLATGFPGREAHVEDHDRLLGHVSELLRSHSTGQRLMTIDLAHSLRAWLVLHIQGKDSVLAEFLSAPGGAAGRN